jgi:hypothetical protein
MITTDCNKELRYLYCLLVTCYQNKTTTKQQNNNQWKEGMEGRKRSVFGNALIIIAK